MNVPRVGIGVAVETDTGFVFLKRQGSHGAGEWSFPGGRLEFGESVIDCAKRETLEEIGVELHDAEIIPFFTEDFYPNQHWITLYVLGRTSDVPRIMEPDKASDLMILDTNENIPEPSFSGLANVWIHLRFMD